MTEEEALLQFEILGHDFFVFEDYQEEVNKIIEYDIDFDVNIDENDI